MTAPVRETYSLSSCIWTWTEALCSEHEICDRDPLGHASFLRRSSTLLPRFLSISPSFVLWGPTKVNPITLVPDSALDIWTKWSCSPEHSLLQTIRAQIFHAVRIPALQCPDRCDAPVWHSLRRNTESREPPVVCAVCNNTVNKPASFCMWNLTWACD